MEDKGEPECRQTFGYLRIYRNISSMASVVCACGVCVYVHEHIHACALESKIGLSPAWDFPGG